MIQAKTQYAIILLSEIAIATTPVHIMDVAKAHQLNLEFLKQVARLLRIASLLKSIRGPGGGYTLSVDKLPISLITIIKAVESKINIKQAVKLKNDKDFTNKIYKKLLKCMNNIIVLDNDA